ncbi:hypothetical protein BGX26_005858, partial [Mortierella sp. AD094]
MVTASITTQGLLRAPSNPHKYKKPKGFRFKFRDTEKEQWEAFADAMNGQLQDKEKMKALGLKGISDVDNADLTEDLRKVDLEEAWRWYSTIMINCAKEILPGKVVGRSGLKPGSELSILHMVRDLGRLKKLAKAARQQSNTNGNNDNNSDSNSNNSDDISNIRNQLIQQQVKFNKHATKMKKETGRDMAELTPVPEAEDTAATWGSWIRDIKDRWTAALVELQTERQVENSANISKWINKRCGQLLTSTGSMIDKLLGRGRGRVVLDKIQVEEDGETFNVLEPEMIKTRVRDWFAKWHGPRPAKPLIPGSRWEKQYRPVEDIEADWYNGLMDPPSAIELQAVIQNAPKYKAPGVSGITNDLFQHQG